MMSEQNLWQYQQPPRQVRLRWGARWFFVPGLILLAVMVGSVVAVPMWFEGRELDTLERLHANGKLAQASFDHLETVEHAFAPSPFSEMVDVEYVFTDRGQRFSLHQKCLPREVPKASVGVLYWPTDPTFNLARNTAISDEEVRHAQQGYWEGFGLGIVLYAGVVILIALPFAIIPGHRDMSRQVDLARRGVAVEAVITRVVPDSLGRCKAHYAFPTFEGACKGKSLVVHRTLKQTELRVGQHVTALVDPHRPTRSILVLALEAATAVGAWDKPANLLFDTVKTN